MSRVSGTLASAVAHHQAGRLREAESLYRLCLHVNPAQGEAHLNLAVVLHDQGRLDEADQSYRAALELVSTCAEAHNNYGTLHHQRGELPGAIACYTRAVELKPDYVAAHFNLGNALRDQGRPLEAGSCYRTALAVNPSFGPAHANLGNILAEQGHSAEAIACYQRAIALQPDLAEAHNSLGTMLYDQGAPSEAVDCYRCALNSQPNYPQAHSNLATALRKLARHAEAIHHHRRAIELLPNSPVAHSGLFFTLQFSEVYSPAAILAEHRLFNERFAVPLADSIQPHLNDPSPDRRLKIGYVSPNFREHCLSLFMHPTFSRHDHQQFEIFLYSDVPCPDGITQRFRATADVWRDTAGLSDDQLAELIRHDQIDIVVDLTMHMDGSRLLAFARKPAPVQVTWLAYPGTTGLSAIDYRLSDPYLDPPGLFDRFYAEESIRLPDTFWCYDPLSSDLPASGLPALDNGHITFGCLNNFCKLNVSTLRLWSSVLVAVPTSRLILLAPEGSCREWVREVLGQQGISPDRVTFVSFRPRRRYLQLYHQVDISLDTLPYNGHTTSLDAYWMGVPVVTLVGQTVVGRAGLSQLTNLGLPELIANTPDQFVQIAAELSTDLPRLAHLRSTLRTRMEESPLMDARRFARAIESAYRMMWHRWCAERALD